MSKSEQAAETAARLLELAEDCTDFTQLQAVGVPAAAVSLIKAKRDLSREIEDLEQRERKLWELLVEVIKEA